MLDYEDQYEEEAEYPGSSEHEAAEDEDEMYSLKVQLVGTSGEQRATLLETRTDTATVIRHLSACFFIEKYFVF